MTDEEARRAVSEKLMFADAPIDRDDVDVDDDAEVSHVDDGAAWVKVWIRVTP